MFALFLGHNLLNDYCCHCEFWTTKGFSRFTNIENIFYFYERTDIQFMALANADGTI